MRGEVHAVCIVWSTTMISEILLQRLERSDFLVKAGNFSTEPMGMVDLEVPFACPPSTQVDWLLL